MRVERTRGRDLVCGCVCGSGDPMHHHHHHQACFVEDWSSHRTQDVRKKQQFEAAECLSQSSHAKTTIRGMMTIDDAVIARIAHVACAMRCLSLPEQPGAHMLFVTSAAQRMWVCAPVCAWGETPGHTAHTEEESSTDQPTHERPCFVWVWMRRDPIYRSSPIPDL